MSVIGQAGREASWAAYRERRQARLDDFDFLCEQGVSPIEAAIRAGWPSLDAAEIALRRACHPKRRILARECQRRRVRSRAA